MKSHTRHVVTTIVVLGVLAIGAAFFIWSGIYNIGADDPHWSTTHTIIETLRERSIESRMQDVQVPDLDDRRRIALGAVNYSAMCTGCHLSPGVDDTEIRPGLYPMPPNLTQTEAEDPRRMFWVIKHGIKMTAMPAWGKTHTDEQIWNMVAFVQKLPGMTPAQYEQLGGNPPAQDEDHMHAGMEEHGDDHMHAGMGEHGDAHAEQPGEPSHAGPAVGEGVMHMHADGTRERHPATAPAGKTSTTVDEHADGQEH